MPERWTRDSWRKKPVLQVPEYPDQAALEAVERQLAGFPPLVFAGEARSLKKALGRVAMGEDNFGREHDQLRRVSLNGIGVGAGPTGVDLHIASNRPSR